MAIHHIDPHTLQTLLETTPDLQLIDVRMPEEFFYLGHIAQARLLPLHELPQQFRSLDVSRPVAVTCQHGIRSLDACHFLQAQGFQTLYNLSEGMASWEAPVERDTTPFQ